MAENNSAAPVPRLPDSVAVINVGLPLFGDAVRAQGMAAVDVDWRIPAAGDPGLVAALTVLHGRHAAALEAANAEVTRRLDAAAPVLVGIARAGEVVPGIEGRTLLHPGPPLLWEAFCDPLRRSARAAAIAEGWASTPQAAGDMIARGEIGLESANHHAAALPMATVLAPSSPVLVVENGPRGNRAFSGINQGPGATAWFGVESPEAVERLVFLRDAVAPVLAAALQASSPIDIFSVAAQGLQMGDDAHMRTQAATNLVLRHLLPALVASDHPRRDAVARFLAGNHLLFLNFAMAAAKAASDWAAEVAGSSIVATMARNGTTFGIRLAGQEAWFVAPAPPVEDALFHPGYAEADAAPDIGDSAVLETLGLGGAAAAASPAVATFLGGKMAGAVGATRAMERITAARSTRFRIPYLDFAGSPVGIDIRRVVAQEVTPQITTGILDARGGRGQVGAGVAHAPLECFQEAVRWLAGALG
ncbi:MAG TPA: DUF1116 domain-containing protein [Actinomycetota bacterium]|nr:DUF1116 domain-containing protein [Actinomycetota bacterium]